MCCLYFSFLIELLNIKIENNNKYQAHYLETTILFHWFCYRQKHVEMTYYRELNAQVHWWQQFQVFAATLQHQPEPLLIVAVAGIECILA